MSEMASPLVQMTLWQYQNTLDAIFRSFIKRYLNETCPRTTVVPSLPALFTRHKIRAKTRIQWSNFTRVYVKGMYVLAQVCLSNWKGWRCATDAPQETGKMVKHLRDRGHHFSGMLVRTRQCRPEAESKSMLNRADLCPWLMEELIW